MQAQNGVSVEVGRLMAGVTSSNIRYFTGAGVAAVGIAGGEAANSAKLAARHSFLPATSFTIE